MAAVHASSANPRQPREPAWSASGAMRCIALARFTHTRTNGPPRCASQPPPRQPPCTGALSGLRVQGMGWAGGPFGHNSGRCPGLAAVVATHLANFSGLGQILDAATAWGFGGCAGRRAFGQVATIFGQMVPRTAPRQASAPPTLFVTARRARCWPVPIGCASGVDPVTPVPNGRLCRHRRHGSAAAAAAGRGSGRRWRNGDAFDNH